MARLILKAPFYKPGNPRRGGYVSYIATREGVEKLQGRGGMASYIGERRGSNGLFTDEGKQIVLSKIMKEVDEHKGNVWGLILSLRREDAERFGYNFAEQWIDLVRSHRNDLARAMHIDPKNFRWYAAFHQAEGHPHVHIMAWSQKPDEPYLSRKGIEKIKQTFATDIFREELYSVYSKQTEARTRIREAYRRRMDELTVACERKEPPTELSLKLESLARRLKKHKGKKQYGYLSKGAKKDVDEIVRILAALPEIDEEYDLWYELQCEKVRTYTDAVPMKLPLGEEKEMRPVRGAVVNAAAKLSQSLPDEEPVQKNAKRNAATVRSTPINAKQNALSSARRPQPGAVRAATVLIFGASILIFNSAPRFTEDEDYEDIDRKLKREIRQVKQGEPMMTM